jgi:DMSO/TMAO reductase YedYZ molybdopterin-dependent catalytic subunit
MTLFEAGREQRRASSARARMAIHRGAFAATATLWARPGDIVTRDDAPPQHETSIAALGRSWLTPNELFFVRQHHPLPDLDAVSWRLEIGGLVRRPLRLTLDALRMIDHVDAVHTLECAGNGRALMQPFDAHGIPWTHGAVGTALWGGVRLADALMMAGVRPEAKHVWFEAADRPRDPSAPAFVRSIPIEKAMQDVLLAHSMNGRPLPPSHGAPLRVVVPGWYAMASTKWLTGVRLEAEPARGHFMTTAYRYVDPARDGRADVAVDEMRVKSMVTCPLEGALVRRGVVHARGFAWGGRGGIARVEVSGDGGRSWAAAHLLDDGRLHPGAWKAWEAWIELRHAGRAAIAARAIDATGAAQPLKTRPNSGGYGNNSVHRVTVEVAA